MIVTKSWIDTLCTQHLEVTLKCIIGLYTSSKCLSQSKVYFVSYGRVISSKSKNTPLKTYQSTSYLKKNTFASQMQCYVHLKYYTVKTALF